MFTMLPYPNMRLSAHVMSTRWLGRQYVEAADLLSTIARGRQRALAYHPLAAAWRPFAPALSVYLEGVWDELELRGYPTGNPSPRTPEGVAHLQLPEDLLERPVEIPDWIGWERLHASHRSWLLYKDRAWYSQFGWDEPPFAHMYMPGFLPEVGEWVIDGLCSRHLVMEYRARDRVFVCDRAGGRTTVTPRQFYTKEWQRVIVNDV